MKLEDESEGEPARAAPKSDKAEPKAEEPAEEPAAEPEIKNPYEGAAALPANGERPPLNRGAALAALGAAASAALKCKRPDGPSGAGRANVTFSPDGPVSTVNISSPFAGTSVGNCIASAFRNARVPPFSGGAITLPKGFAIPDE